MDVRDIPHQDKKLVSSPTADHVAFPETSFQVGGGCLQYPVSDLMAADIVHIFKIIQINDQQGVLILRMAAA